MDAKIKAVRWYWQKVVDMRLKVRELCEVAGVEYDIDLAEDRKVLDEIAELDGLVAEGFTHLRPVKKTR